MNRRKILLGVACSLAASYAAGATDTQAVANSAPASRSAVGKNHATSQPAVAVKGPDLPALTAQQIVDRNAQARGGLAAWTNVRSMSMSGKMDAGKVRKDGGKYAQTSALNARLAKAELRSEVRKASMAQTDDDSKVIQLPFQLELKRPLKTRLEIPFQGDTAVQVYDGAHGWKLRPYLGRREVEPFTADETRISSQQQELDGLLLNHAAKGTQVALDGTEMVKGQPAYRLKLTLKDSSERRVWIDSKTFLEAKVEGAPRHFDGKMRVVTTSLGDYRKVDGLMIPHLLETNVAGVAGGERIIVQKVTLNPALPDSRFAKPV